MKIRIFRAKITPRQLLTAYYKSDDPSSNLIHTIDHRSEKPNLSPLKLQSGGYEILSNEELKGILEKQGLLKTIGEWRVLFAALDVTHKPNRKISWKSDYIDSNNNQIMDDDDEGFFNPASTIKTAIAALVLEWLNQHGIPRKARYAAEGCESFMIEDDLRSMQVISDNPATNRLIMLLGFDEIDRRLITKGISNFSIERLMLDGGTLVKSPAHRLNYDSQVWNFPSNEVTRVSRCHECSGRPGNGASMDALIEIMMRITQPHEFPGQSFDLRENDRLFLLDAMARTPSDQGFGEYRDDWNRFLHSLEKELVGRNGRLISKGGVALWSKTWTDQSYLVTEDGRKVHMVISVRPPEEILQTEAFPWMAKLALALMNLLKI